MARIECKCGETLWDGLVPNDVQLYVFTDRTMDKILADDDIGTIELSNMNDYEVWLFPKCKRLFVFEKNSNSAKYIYKLET